MRDYASIVTRMLNTVWLMEPTALQTMLDIVAARVNGEIVTDEEIMKRIQDARLEQGDRKYETAVVVNGVGVLPLYGPIFPKANLMTDYSGATSLESVRTDFANMLQDESVKSIVMDVDSPGGAHEMLPEVAEEIFSARGIKPMVAVANTNMHSAAYFLASQMDKVYATPSGFLGCIGTMAVHEDVSQQMANEGRKFTIFKSAQNKTEGNPYEPLSDSARAHIQDIVDQCGAEFEEAVARGRGITVDEVKQNYGGGRSFKTSAALDRGMIDGVQTIESVIGSFVESGGSVDVRPATSFARSSYEADLEHSEPGTGSPPTPRESPNEDDLAIKNGWRRDSPPAAFEDPEQEDSIMNREQLVALATSLGVQVNDEWTDDELSSAIVTHTNDVVAPLVRTRDEVAKRRSLQTDYPDAFDRLIRLEQADRRNNAREFADAFKTGLKDASGNETSRGFSALCLEKIEDSHLAISEGTFSHENLKDLLDAAGIGVVDYGEHGSSREKVKEVPANGTLREKRQAFADAVEEKMTQDEMTIDKAMKMVADEQPELAAAYLGSQ